MSTQTAPTRTVQGRDFPAPGTWAIDPAHSQVQFAARHMMISKVRGRFRDFSGTVHVGQTPEESWVEATIRAGSIDTGDEGRDRHLRSPDFLDIERYPEITYRSTSIRPGKGQRWLMEGDLTIRDVTRAVTLDFEFCGTATDPWDNLRAGYMAEGEIDREDFAVSWNQALEAGGFLVGRGVRIEVDVETVLTSPPDG